MSVGIDIGNATSCVALARGAAATSTILTNADGLRETPSVVFYGENSRAVGYKASTMLASSPNRTITEVKRLIGRPHLTLQDKNALLYDMRQSVDGGSCLISVPQAQDDSDVLFRPEQVMVSLMKNLKETADAGAGTRVHSYGLSIPCFYGQAERSAVLAAAKVAGLESVYLVHELTAAAVWWGASRADLPEDGCAPKHVAFVDVGHSATQVGRLPPCEQISCILSEDVRNDRQGIEAMHCLSLPEENLLVHPSGRRVVCE